MRRRKAKQTASSSKKSKGFGTSPSLGQFSVPLIRKALSPSFLCHLMCTSGFWSSKITVSLVLQFLKFHISIWLLKFSESCSIRHACYLVCLVTFHERDRRQWVWALYVEPELFLQKAALPCIEASPCWCKTRNVNICRQACICLSLPS